MPTEAIDKILPFATDDMFDLVKNIERYPDFINWVKAMRILESEETHKIAEILLAFKGFSGTFTTKVEPIPNRQRVNITLVDGPLKHLDAHWEIFPHEDGARIHFEMDYAFSNRVLALLARMNMDKAIEKILQAFINAAEFYYTPLSMPDIPSQQTGDTKDESPDKPKDNDTPPLFSPWQ